MSNDDDAELTRRVTRGGVTTRTTTKGGKKSKTKKEGELTMMRTGNTQNKKGGKGGKGAKGKGGAGTSKASPLVRPSPPDIRRDILDRRPQMKFCHKWTGAKLCFKNKVPAWIL
ncbi:uncharacterized protein LOC119171444 isoform X2 [Rhipicephalus microplus]|uniref:uncharacterized protein LOC119171444 isoform X2 n=1 Tax=Rhipicephalus microplus TaxID=6941 RepID=UPI003F6A9ECE